MKAATYRAFLSSLLALSSLTSGKLVKEDTATKTLVVVDDWATVETHSRFFSHIKDTLGHKLEFSIATSVQKFKHHDAYYFDNIVLMSPSIKGKSQLFPSKLIHDGIRREPDRRGPRRGALD